MSNPRIEIVGTQDRKMQKLYERVKKIIIKKRLITKINIIPESRKPIMYKNSAIPALYIDKQMICAGRIPDTKELEKVIN